MSAQQIIEMALQLKPAERLLVLDQLHRSLDQPDPVIEQLWTDEASRRLDAHRRGELQSVPMDAVFPQR